MSEHTIAFVRSTVARFPGLGAVLEEHARDNFGEILPHMFFGELTEYTVSLLANSESHPGHGSELREILDYLEDSFASEDEEVQEMIAVSFIENLQQTGDAEFQIVRMLGPKLREQASIMGVGNA